MPFSTSECAWKHITINILGRTIVGLKGFEFNDNLDSDYLRGSGNQPLDIQEGDESYPGSVDIMKFELDLLNDAAVKAGYRSIIHVPHYATTITCTYKKNPTDPIRKTTAFGVKFQSWKVGMRTGDKETTVTLPFISMLIQ